MRNLIKTTAFLLAFAGCLQSAIAQVRIYPVFNSIISGRSINLLASGQIKNRHEFGGGLRININKYAHNDDQGNIYKKRMYATKPLHYFGVEGFYHVHFLQKLQHFDFFAFYDIQLVYSTTGNRMPRHYRNPLTGECELSEPFRHFGPFTWVEQNIGIGFTVDIWKNFFLTQRLGAGAHFILGEDPWLPNEIKPYWLAKSPFTWEFGYVLSVGLGYRFEPKKQKQ